MKCVLVLAILALVSLEAHAKYPPCTAVGFFANVEGPPNDPIDGWYSYCYKNANGKYTIYPYRCPKSTTDSTVYQQFDGTCQNPAPPTTNGTATS